MVEMSQSLLVIDGTALAFRAFFAMPDLSDDQGRPSGALHGFLGSLNRVISELPADLIVVVTVKKTQKLLEHFFANFVRLASS